MNKLTAIQCELKAPKNQHNSFGGYNYRSCEDILEAVKPLLEKHDVQLAITDNMVEVGGRVYVEATAKLNGKDGTIAEVRAFAREAETKKGMDESQITGSASSYARKYALNGLFLIDDTKDADATNTHDTGQSGGVKTTQGQAPAQTDDHERVKQSLHALYGSDKQAALDAVEKMTGFKGKDGWVAGVRDYTKLKGKRLEILAEKLEKEVADKRAQPKEEPAICSECRNPLSVGGFCETDGCPKNDTIPF